MLPVLFTIPMLGGVPVFGYGLTLFCAFAAATALATRQGRRVGIGSGLFHDLALTLIIGGLIGARVFYVAQYWGTRIHGLADAFRVWEGGIVLYGSIIGGTIAFFAFRLARPLPLRPGLDCVAPALALGVAIGRFGCFLNGCCFGDPSDLPWAVAFPPMSPAWLAQVDAGLIESTHPHALPVHPTQLYSTLDGIVLTFLLLAYAPLRRRDGEAMALLMVTYPISRFLIEHLRSDERVFLAGMTVSQCISVALFLLGCLFWWSLRRGPAGDRVGEVALGADSAHGTGMRSRNRPRISSEVSPSASAS